MTEDIITARKRFLKEEAEKPDEFVDKKLSPYDFILQIVDKKDKYAYDKKVAPAFLLLQWFSQNYYTVDIVQEINHLQFTLKDEIIYQYLFDRIPKYMKIPKWIKKQNNSDWKGIEIIQKQYNVSKREALMIQNHQRRIKKNGKNK